MPSNPNDQTVIQRLCGFFDREDEGIVCVYLYGSIARGASRAGSDIDLAVLYAEEPPPTLDGLGLALSSRLEQYLGLPVDIVVLNGAPVDLVHRIFRDGRLICDRDPSVRIRFEVQARNAYFDLLPYLRQYRRAVWSPKS